MGRAVSDDWAGARLSVMQFHQIKSKAVVTIFLRKVVEV
jgi:hypothetical protein